MDQTSLTKKQDLVVGLTLSKTLLRPSRSTGSPKPSPLAFPPSRELSISKYLPAFPVLNFPGLNLLGFMDRLTTPRWLVVGLAGLLFLGCKKAPEPTNRPMERIVWVKADNSTTLLSIDEYGRITLRGKVIATDPELGGVIKKYLQGSREAAQ